VPAAVLDGGPPRHQVASFPPPIAENPYQRLLYEALKSHGLDLVVGNRLKLDWLWRSRRQVSALHFHWPQGYYRHERGPERLRRPLSWLRLVVFAARLAAARSLGYRIIWTIHQVYPHEPGSRRLESLAVRVLARASHAFIVHDATTEAAATAVLGRRADRIRIVPHGTYAGVYGRRRSRQEIRKELRIAPDALVFLCFGHVRAYKMIDVLLEAFGRANLPQAVLVVAGLPLDAEASAAVATAAARDRRIRAVIEFVPDDDVADLHTACDVAVLARSDGGTSGALVLALSLGLPVVAAAVPAYEDLTHGGELGWHFAPGDADSLRATLEEAATDEGASSERAARAARRAAPTGWDDVASSTAAVFREVLT
jgi:beta-1,4-mannosyltransferase